MTINLFSVFFAVIYLLPPRAEAARETVLKQIDLPHNYYFREMYLPQVTSGPSSLTFTADGQALVYSMAGSLWLQRIGEDSATELTHGPGYDFQPDASRDGRHIAFVRHAANAIELWQLDLQTRQASQLTRGGAVNLEPRYSPDGKHLAFVSTAGSGHFNLQVADLDGDSLSGPRALVEPRNSVIDRYYYSTHDHAINPSWTPDGKRVVFVTNREIAYGTGDLCSVAVERSADVQCFDREETSWQANPEVAPDGKRVLYASYQGRQWHQLWLTTLAGEPPLPLTFGNFDRTHARWSPDGRRIAYVSNETGNLRVWVLDASSGEQKPIAPRRKSYLQPMHAVVIQATDANGKTLPARFSIVGSDRRAYAPEDAWVHADDGFDPAKQVEETRYFHCSEACTVMLPAGTARVTAWHGQASMPAQQSIDVKGDRRVTLKVVPLELPEWAPRTRTADLHVHMNYGGHYRHTLETLTRQASAEDLDVIFNLIVNKEQRIPDIELFSTTPYEKNGVTVFQGQEHHSSFWGHLGLLGLREHLVLPDFTAYSGTAMASPFPFDGKVAESAHRQGALVGYVHPYDNEMIPEHEKTLSHMFPIDVATGRADYVEVVGFSDHKSTADVWYRLLNLGYRVPTGSGTDAMANYASLRGPVGMNRVYLQTSSTRQEDLLAALKAGKSVASNGPQLALQVEGKNLGEEIALASGHHRLHFTAAMRSPVAMEHLELLQNGRVVASYRFGRDRTRADWSGTVDVDRSGWIALRAWNEGADPLLFDLYPYATTSPVYLTVSGAPASSSKDAEYFVRWVDRVIEAAEARGGYNSDAEKRETLDYLLEARKVFVDKSH